MNTKEIYDLFVKMDINQIKNWLKQYATNPAKQNPVIPYQSLALLASIALENIPYEQRPTSYVHTDYGVELYFWMIGLN